MTGEDDRGYTEMPRTGNFPVSRTMPIQQGSPFLRPYCMVSSYNTVAQQHQITGFLGLQNTPSYSDYTRTAGYGSRSTHPSKHVLFSGARGNFTQSQIIELDKQFWIAKHLMENEALPSHLLNYLYGSTRTFSVGSGSNNAKPGRCRRRDGKKWRCSRNVIQQQKFCWEHKYRAQTHYRSRKLVDGPTHQALTGPTNSNVVVPPITFSMSTSTAGGASTLQPCATIPFADAIVIREDVSCERVEDRPHNLCSLVPGLGSSDSHSSFLLNSESNVDEFLIDLILSDDEESQDQESHHNSKMDEFFIDLTLSDEETQDQESRHKSNDELESSMINWPDNFDTEWT